MEFFSFSQDGGWLSIDTKESSFISQSLCPELEFLYMVFPYVQIMQAKL